MVRPRTSIGTAGKLTVVGQVQNAPGRDFYRPDRADGAWIIAPQGVRPTRWRARTRHRDPDGCLRDVERIGTSRANAEMRLKNALATRTAPAGSGEMRSDMELRAAGHLWLALVRRADSDLADSTREQYEAAFSRYVENSQIARLTLREANRVAVLESYLQGVADNNGSGAAKTARSVVASILKLAVRYQVLDSNAMREVRPAKASKKRETPRDTTRAFTRKERDALLIVADKHERARHQDVTDIIYFLAGTGVRISEALGVLWADVDLDRPGGPTVHIRGTKTAASNRVLSLPTWLADRLRTRSESADLAGRLFPSPGILDTSKIRDRRNVQRILREVFDAAGHDWATPHTFRRTVATLLDEAGEPIALAANQLGHANPAMTASVYLGRKGDLSAAARVL